MSTSPSEAPEDLDAETLAPGTLEELASAVAAATGGEAAVAFGTAKVRVAASEWVATLTTARDRFGLVFFSWLSAIDWANTVEVGDALVDEVEERYEVLAAVSDLGPGRMVVFSADLGKERPVIGSLVAVYPGANWHEREAHEMFGIEFAGHPQLRNLYLPDGFQGHPLRKSFPLLSREVKPWPGKVDVEGMPGKADEPDEASIENPEA